MLTKDYGRCRAARARKSVMVDPSKVAFYFPPEINRGPKLALFERISGHVRKLGGRIIRGDHAPLEDLPPDVIPIVGCSVQLSGMIAKWREAKRNWLYWDRGYYLRVYNTHVPRGQDGGSYRWHMNEFQLSKIGNTSPERWQVDLNQLRRAGGVWSEMPPDGFKWRKGGRHIVIAAPTRTYSKFHRTESWVADTLYALSLVTDRQLVVRDKESKRTLQSDLADAHCLVTHGSNAAVEAAILGTAVFVHSDSAAALVGQTDLKTIETPVYPDRHPWLCALANNQFRENELVNGSLWSSLS